VVDRHRRRRKTQSRSGSDRAPLPAPSKTRRAGAADDPAAERTQRAFGVPRRRLRSRLGQTAGALRPRRVPPPPPPPPPDRLRPPLPRRPPRPDHPGPPRFLDRRVSGGAQGTTRPLPKTPLAGGSMDGTGDAPDEEALATAAK